ncbi:NIL domain-containing protein [Hippea maritima]|uniref:NIL domain-containing protein n=1 Tax=Hippea maritima (strain ATCC 700847 / DSM 10411 / MH2) TaxID=760142 RepID=F2LX83_HIPMA|nr:NIL domain-containing protein [Hippea maritima]AEA33141.1 NIL domain-containing protein [Hippea maritima DSM 10411]
MISKKIVLRFPKDIADKPLISDICKKYDLTFNIMKANIFPRKEGVLTLEISGEDKAFYKGIDYLKQNGVELTFVEESIKRNEEKCYHCGFCVAVCPTQALTINDRKTMRVDLYKDRCIACGYCVKVCPVKAMNLENEI